MEEKENMINEEIIDPALLGMAAQPKNMLVRNHFYFYDEISVDTCKSLIINLSELAMTNVKTMLETGLEMCPIHLHICSPGGDLTAALAIVSFFEKLKKGEVTAIGGIKVPIELITHIEGEADSGGSLIATLGSKRYCSRNALSLIHPMRTLDFSSKTPEEQEQNLENNKRWNEIYKRVYVEHSKLKDRDLEEMFKKEKFYTPEELLKFGLIEGIED